MILKQQDTFFKEKGAYETIKEIRQQPQMWLDTLNIINDKKEEIDVFLNSFFANQDYRIILTGAGSSEFVGNSMTDNLLRMYDDRIESIATTRIVSNPELYISDKATLLISFGRSGNSPESIAAVELADQLSSNVYHIIITCNKESSIATFDSRNKKLVICLPDETHDKGFAMTSSFTSMYLAAYTILNLDKYDSIKSEIVKVNSNIEVFNNDYLQILDDKLTAFEYNRIVYLGANSIKGIAQESALKMLELTTGDVVSLHDTPLGFRHGPKSFITDKTLIVLYATTSEYTQKYDLDLFNEIVGNGVAKVLVVGAESGKELYKDAYLQVNFDSELSVFAYSLIDLYIAQNISVHKSLTLNKTTDNPFPSGVVNRVVQGVVIHKYNKGE